MESKIRRIETNAVGSCRWLAPVGAADAGLIVLIEALGEADTERFITLINREPFDYTIGQKKIFQGMSVYDVSKKAMSVRKKM